MLAACITLPCWSLLDVAGQLDWIFWTKLGIVALSVIGGFIFMYIQCKVYHHLWRRLKAFNCVILVHNCQDTVCNGSEHIVPFPQTQATVPAGETAEVTPVWFSLRAGPRHEHHWREKPLAGLDTIITFSNSLLFCNSFESSQRNIYIYIFLELFVFI